MHDPHEAMDLQEEMQALDRRVFQLWGTLTALTLALTAGLAAVLLPEILKAHGNGQPIPQLISGLLILVILLNVYLWKQRRYLVKTREAVLRERTRRELAEAMAVLDPLTDSFNRRYMETVIAKEVSRADRLGSSLVFVMIDVDNFKSVNTRFGHVVGDRVLREVAEILKQSCRSFRHDCEVWGRRISHPAQRLNRGGRGPRGRSHSGACRGAGTSLARLKGIPWV